MFGRVLAVALLLALPALAGCASKAPAAGEPVSQNGNAQAPFSDASTVAPSPVVRTTSQRWHFHDYWHGSPVITLLNTTVTLNVSADDNGARVLSTLVTLPPSVIVPAETGFLTVNVSWPSDVPGAAPAAGGAVNVTYKPADSNQYFGAGNLSNGKPAFIVTTESMCDVPHRQDSLWRFNLTAVPNGTPPLLPARDVRVNVTATIGRPLFIDPPHLDWWLGNTVLPLVTNAKGDIAATVTTKGGNLTLPMDPAGATPTTTTTPVRVGVDKGRIVPEGAGSVIVLLNWTTSAPNVKLSVRYQESNLPSEGMMKVVKDGAASRVFALPVQPAQTDTTYSNRTTWEFHVKPDPSGVDTGAFHGQFTLFAWVSTLPPEDAVKAAGLA